MPMRRIWLSAIAALPGCAEPGFEFRGISDVSSCVGAIDAELANGSRFVGGFPSEDPENPGFVTELDGEIFDEQVRIDIHCDMGGFLSSVHYYSQSSDPRDTGAAFHRIAAELEAQFGTPTVIATEQGRSLRYLCHNPSPVLLDEWRLVPEDETTEPEHELYLAVLPPAAKCLDQR